MRGKAPRSSRCCKPGKCRCSFCSSGALQAGRIAGASLDVFPKQQPLPQDNPLWRMPNVIITPNIGGRSDVYVEQTLTIIEPNLRAFIEGRLKDLRNLVAR